MAKMSRKLCAKKAAARIALERARDAVGSAQQEVAMLEHQLEKARYVHGALTMVYDQLYVLADGAGLLS